ncbi:MAG TPA: hypothetical protein VLA44_08905 [Clostridia bacterium]|nr:hypothetical protein [Clostridia bacterium]
MSLVKPSRRARAGRAVRGLALAIAWTAVALLISAGAAGIIVGFDHVPGTGARAELTWAGDEAATARLDAVQADLEALRPMVDELGVDARGALASLAGQDLATVQAAVDEGAALVSEIDDASLRIRTDLAAVPGTSGRFARLITSDAVRERHAAMVDALDATEGLDVAWDRLTRGSIAAARLSQLLADHDRTMGEAILEGRDRNYPAAIDIIDDAGRFLDEADGMRGELARTVDVSTLDEWLSRNRTYDAALRELYSAIRASGGVRTDEVTDALAKERAARRQLPPDTRGLVVIMAEIGQGGLNGAVIAIEQARGALADAIRNLPAASPTP